MYVLNSGWIQDRGRALSATLDGIVDRYDRVLALYRRILGRAPTERETPLALEYLAARRGKLGREPWDEYADGLLATNELSFPD